MFATYRRQPSAHALEHVGLFAGCSRPELEAIDHLTTRTTVAPGAVLCREGCVGRQAFILTVGEAVVTVADTEIARLGPGTICGEMALLDREMRNATVTAVTDLEVLALSLSEFAQLRRCAPTVAQRVLAIASKRRCLSGTSALQ